ncbi:MAG: tRNA (adenosine(37)-N6)-dimethylallyltransferase MiaA [Syntrophus sp. (in: bacteria)]|nr:tRNA (adenosine(37)-N6)-dimethylallyltransferase MiaA [Syntrophus sp. (in: bacteria)]
MNINLIVILGPTASGKTTLAVHLAKYLGSEIISADSRQIYRGMDLGTGKDLSEYCVDGVAIPCHLIDIIDADADYSVFDYQQRFFQCFAEISSRGVLPILAGGTGLYLESVLNGYQMCAVPYNPALRKELAEEPLENLVRRLLALRSSVHNKSDILDRSRLIRAIEIAGHSRLDPVCPSLPCIEALVVGVRWERRLLRQRITVRLRQRLAAGMIEEVRSLHASGVSWERLHYFGLEYRYIGLYLQGILDYQTMFETLNTKIHQFAKRQETWFRRMVRNGRLIHWLDGADHDSLRKIIENNVRMVQR